jgi:hypothetical protein
MAGHILSRHTALGLAVAVVIGAGAAAADAAGTLKGSPAAVRVAQQVLAHARHLNALEWHERGDEWACPADGGPIVGPALKRPEPDCHRATVTFDENLRHGVIVGSLTSTTAPGMAAQAELVTPAGDWTRTGSSRCWDPQGVDFRRIPAFSYAGERLSITGETSSVISLRGVKPGLRETDTIDARTFAVREIDEEVPAFGGTARLVATFAEPSHMFGLPTKPRHLCSGIVRFPPQRAR